MTVLNDNNESQIEVCLATRLFFPYYSGGALRYMRYFPGLQARQIGLQVFTGTPSLDRAKAFDGEQDISWLDVPQGSLLPTQDVNGVPVYRVRLPNHGVRNEFWQYGRSLANFCKNNVRKPEIVQFMPLPLWSSPWLIQLKKLEIKTVIGYNLLDKFSPNKWKRRLQGYYWRLPFQMVDCIVVNSVVMQEALREFGIATRIEVIPNGVDLEKFQHKTDQTALQLRQQLSIPFDAPVIISVGSVEPRKGSDLLMEAWISVAAHNPDAHLVIVGPRPDLSDPSLAKFHQKLMQDMKQSQAAERVHFVGYAENVEAYLQMADIFVFTSRREGLPNVVFEAMASQLPVAMTSFIGMSAEVGVPGEHFMLTEFDAKSIATSLTSLIQDKELRDKFGKNGRRWVEEQMNLETSLDNYANLYRELATT